MQTVKELIDDLHSHEFVKIEGFTDIIGRNDLPSEFFSKIVKKHYMSVDNENIRFYLSIEV